MQEGYAGTVVAMMRGQLDPQPGDNVLEIGAGTGYNAALLAELVGESGRVTTIDIRPDVTDHARRDREHTPALVEGDSLAYLAKPRRVEDSEQRRQYELGASGHGPAGAQLAARLYAQIRAWDSDRSARPTITAYPASSPDELLRLAWSSTSARQRLVLSR